MNPLRATRRVADSENLGAAERLQGAFARYQDELLGTLYYLLGNFEDARDTYQEAFLKCWRHRDEVPQIENLRAWIFRVAANAARDVRGTAWRRRRRTIEEGEGDLIADGYKSGNQYPGQGPEAAAIRREQLALVRRALGQLRPEEQEVFLLRQNGEMTYQQIAESINIPVGTVKTRMRLALAKLSDALQTDVE